MSCTQHTMSSQTILGSAQRQAGEWEGPTQSEPQHGSAPVTRGSPCKLQEGAMERSSLFKDGPGKATGSRTGSADSTGRWWPVCFLAEELPPGNPGSRCVSQEKGAQATQRGKLCAASQSTS